MWHLSDDDDSESKEMFNAIDKCVLKASILFEFQTLESKILKNLKRTAVIV